eukprot:284861_1
MTPLLSYSLHVKADDGLFSSIGSINPLSFINALKLETTGYGNQLLIPMDNDILSFTQSWGDYFSYYVKIWNFREGIRELHVKFDESVTESRRKEVGRALTNHININGGITPKQIVNIIVNKNKLEITTTKEDKGTPEQNDIQQDKSWQDYINPNQLFEWKDFRLVDIHVVVYANTASMPPL